MIKQFFKCGCKGRHFILIHKHLALFYSNQRCDFPIFLSFFTFFGFLKPIIFNKICTFAKLFKQLMTQWNNLNLTYN